MRKNNFFQYLLFTSFGFFQLTCTAPSTQKEEVIHDFPPEETVQISHLEQALMDQGLVNIQTIDPEIMVELKYSTTDNFFGEDVYGNLENAYLQPKVTKALKNANSNLQAIFPNYRLLVYDGVRPHSIQKILWDKLDSIPSKLRKNYVADPDEGSIHNYGCAVDLTIYDLNSLKPLDMGTKYDYFGALAYPRLETQMLLEGKLTQNQIDNRKILRNIMTNAGFQPITSEWWHFNFHSRKTAKLKYQIIE